MLVVLMVGIAGSGKSYTAAKLKNKDTVICSADHYFMKDGVYVFDKDKLHEAHKQCQKTFLTALEEKKDRIIIDNTNVNNKERIYYIKQALANKYHVVMVVLEHNLQECLQRNQHGVTLEVLERMQSRLDISPGIYLVKHDAEGNIKTSKTNITLDQL